MQIAWRDAPAVAGVPAPTPAARLLSVVLHGAAIVVLMQWSGVSETLVEQFDQPPLVVSLAAPPPTASAVVPERTLRRAAEPLRASDPAPVTATAPMTPDSGETAYAQVATLAVGDLAPIGAVVWPDAAVTGGQYAGTGPAGGATGTPGAGAPGQAVEPAASAPLFDAAYLNNPRPAYPEAAVRRGITGVVMLRVLVSAEGRADAVSIEQSSGSRLLDESALQTVRTAWHFVPARKGGVPVPATVIVPVRFELEPR